MKCEGHNSQIVKILEGIGNNVILYLHLLNEMCSAPVPAPERSAGLQLRGGGGGGAGDTTIAQRYLIDRLSPARAPRPRPAPAPHTHPSPARPPNVCVFPRPLLGPSDRPRGRHSIINPPCLYRKYFYKTPVSILDQCAARGWLHPSSAQVTQHRHHNAGTLGQSSFSSHSVLLCPQPQTTALEPRASECSGAALQ